MLSKAAGCRIFLKLDHLQPSGSFKSRGIGNLCLSAMKRARNPDNIHFFSSSGGNAGLACVYAANSLGRQATVVVPMATTPMMKAKIKAAGAREVVQYGESWKEADTYMREVVIPHAEAHGVESVYVPPFDHPDIWEGNSTLIDELRQQFAELGESPPEVVGCSVGGGGLFIGMAQAMERLGGAWDDTQIIGVETKGAESLGACLDSNEHKPLDKIYSQAVTLACRTVAARAFELATRLKASGKFNNFLVSDAEAAQACCRFADDERILVELACGAALALCYDGRLKKALGRPVYKDDKVVIVVCGGSAVNTSIIEHWKEEFAEETVNSPISVNGSNGILIAA